MPGFSQWQPGGNQFLQSEACQRLTLKEQKATLFSRKAFFVLAMLQKAMHLPCMATPLDSTLQLPPIALADLPPATKDFLLAASVTGKSPVDVIREVLTHAAEKAGFQVQEHAPA
jgi:hypothetical protein